MEKTKSRIEKSKESNFLLESTHEVDVWRHLSYDEILVELVSGNARKIEEIRRSINIQKSTFALNKGGGKVGFAKSDLLAYKYRLFQEFE